MYSICDDTTFKTRPEGVVLLSKRGQVTDFNPAARPWLKSCLQASEQIAHWVECARRAQSTTPTRVELFPAGHALHHSVEVLLCPDGKDGFGLLFTPLGERPWPEA